MSGIVSPILPGLTGLLYLNGFGLLKMASNYYCYSYFYYQHYLNIIGDSLFMEVRLLVSTACSGSHTVNKI